jgi:hypothetical protein
MKAVILGAGSTIGTFDNPSLGVQAFADRLDKVRPAWRNDYPQLADALEKCGSGNLDHLWTYMEYTSHLRRSLCPKTDCPRTRDNPDCRGHRCEGQRFGSDLSGQLRKALLDAYALEDEFAKLPKAASFTLKDIVGSLRDGDVLISFNWDTVAERLARDLGVSLRAAGRPPLDHSSVWLIKPHGSLSWEDRGEHEDLLWNDGRGAPRFDPIAVDRVFAGTSYLQPFVLGAVPIKVELLAETQPNQAVYTVLADQWAAVVDAVSRATELIVVGYGFPAEDGHGRFLFRQAARRRPASLSAPATSYYALPHDSGRIEDALRDIFGSGMSYAYLGPVEGPRRPP